MFKRRLNLIGTIKLPKLLIFVAFILNLGRAAIQLIIPEKVNGHVVTAIGDEALWGVDVKSITLPDTVKSIGRHAFRSCDKLETIRIPEGVTSIENSVFMDCISLKDVTIPSSVTAIGNRAFSGCLSLTGISFPSAIMPSWAARG